MIDVPVVQYFGLTVLMLVRAVRVIRAGALQHLVHE